MRSPTLRRPVRRRAAATRPRPVRSGRPVEVDRLHAHIVASLAGAGVGAHDCDLDALAESVLAEAISIAAAWLER